MVMIAIHRVVYIVLMKDETNTGIHREKFVSLQDAVKEQDQLSWDYPTAKIILLRQEGDAVQVLYTHNPMGV